VANVRYNGLVELPKIAVRLRVPAGGASAALIGELSSAAEQAEAEAFFVDGDRQGEAANDPFVVLGAAAASTFRIGLGCLASPIEERRPSVLAKTLASLDVCCDGRAIAVIAANFSHGVDPAGTLVEAVLVLKRMLEVPAPSFHGEHFSITRAWNEPRAIRERPMPIGVAIGPASSSDRAETLQGAEVAAALAEGVDFLVFDWHSESAKPVSGDIPALALVDNSPGSETKRTISSAYHAGFAGVVLNFSELPHKAALVRALEVAHQSG
jgi:alkanesulfonate monooxygenase SsuD/methylene tetrahydromethanopterin reductase-like flavin-dependent oxidoreductase (luciferase family)